MALWVLPESLALATPSTPVAVLLALLLGVAVATYAYVTRRFAHWSNKGVPFLRPLPFAGNLLDVILFRKHIGQMLQEVYTNMKEQRYLGMFFFDQPVLFVKDRAIIKTICHKDFEHFTNRGFLPTHADTFNREALFGREGKDWKDLRVKLSPAFTSGKLKRFYVLLEHKAAHLATYFDDAVREGTPRNVHDACSRFTMDAVSSVGFGLEGRALLGDDDPLHRLLRSIFVFSRLLSVAVVGLFARVPVLLKTNIALSPEPLRQFLRRTIWAVVREREAKGLQGVRGDFLDLLMELREKGRIAGDDESAAAPDIKGSPIYMDGDVFVTQTFTFLSAGFETSSTTMSFALYHLAKDDVVQDELRAQLKRALDEHNGKLSYDALQSVSYMDMVLSETLRLYPILPFIDRVCTKTYQVENSDLIIEKGTILFGSTLGIQRDPELYPDPDRFDPERFSEANKKSLPSDAYLPFGDGPRMCIGMRLGLLQAKVGLAHIILNYKLHPCATTPPTMEYNLYSSMLLQPNRGVPLMFSRIEE